MSYLEDKPKEKYPIGDDIINPLSYQPESEPEKTESNKNIDVATYKRLVNHPIIGSYVRKVLSKLKLND